MSQSISSTDITSLHMTCDKVVKLGIFSPAGPTQNMKVFIPRCCLNADSGWLVGWQDEDLKIVCIFSVLHPTSGLKISDARNLLQSESERGAYKLGILGKWVNTTENPVQEVPSNSVSNLLQDCWVELIKDDTDIPHVDPQGNWNNHVTQNDPRILIVYDQAHILKSAFQVVDLINTANQSDFDVAFSALRCHRCFFEEQSGLQLTHSKSANNKRASVTSRILAPIWTLLCLIQLAARTIVKICRSSCLSRIYQNEVFCSVVQYPTVGSQVALRLGHLSTVIRGRVCDLALSLVLDVLLGVAVFLFLSKGNYTKTLATNLIPFADYVASELQALLHWLMGAPAGLKLNRPLDEFLGRFFLYHIQLWIGYLYILRPYLELITWCIGLSGCLGMSVLLALASDTLSMLTFHIYCFYVYAARLYRLQLYGLGSLWRLFTGKKWNPLRQRVDSCQYNVDQLFLGTLLFTILLFLLPTTALYYVVFTAFRMAVLILQGVLTKVITTISSFPLFSVLLQLCNGESMAGGITFQVLPQVEDRPLCLSVQVVPVTMATVLERHSLQQTGQEELTSWSMLGRKLLTGDLIYPWGGNKP
ncbi:phosphatidylinositol N-acetylglucosaminyltransferase subunit Q-like isoform X2 [Branchiostoma floridae]|uniref:Phosphatidylinositol N-acetylglucosaminyltransferase subunit Q-like isoform X2 n=1 Tax=Branchiostoma floridae TaxID=7739 RepID=A0A9J7MB46_BRAFL|nr:phosphatidylinositol N-acetylglucosaminyltransferase subunit Q-like isoform X2 [Branchiostoma floridae]